MERMNRAPRVVIALLLLAALSASLASAGLVHAIAHSDDESYCCCPSPEECHCTANCCNHGPAAERHTSTGDGPVVRSSISCRFPVLPDGSLSRAAGSHAAPFTIAGDENHAAPADRAGRLTEFAGTCQYESFHSAASPRGPPRATLERC
jgi:hypothetical protein